MLKGPEILNLSAIFLVASLTCEANSTVKNSKNYPANTPTLLQQPENVRTNVGKNTGQHMSGKAFLNTNTRHTTVKRLSLEAVLEQRNGASPDVTRKPIYYITCTKSLARTHKHVEARVGPRPFHYNNNQTAQVKPQTRGNAFLNIKKINMQNQTRKAQKHEVGRVQPRLIYHSPARCLLH